MEQYDARKFFGSLEKAQVLIYRRMDFLSDDFEYEQYIGQGVLRNIFKEQVVDETQDSIVLPFPERWINIIECHQLFPRLHKYYPNLKTLQIKTQQPLIITGVPREYAAVMSYEDDMARTTGGSGHIDKPTSVEDECAIFKDISKGKMFAI